MSDTHIETCPLCGGVCRYIEFDGDPDVVDTRNILCTNRKTCGYRVTQPMCHRKELLIAAHNKRVMSDEVRDVFNRLIAYKNAIVRNSASKCVLLDENLRMIGEPFGDEMTPEELIRRIRAALEVSNG